MDPGRTFWLINISALPLQPYLHQSRHNHAARRVRGAGGRFLTADEAKSLNPEPSAELSEQQDQRERSSPGASSGPAADEASGGIQAGGVQPGGVQVEGGQAGAGLAGGMQAQVEAHEQQQQQMAARQSGVSFGGSPSGARSSLHQATNGAMRQLLA